MQRYKLYIEYVGAPYSGWQIQDHAKTVQGQIQYALWQVTSKHIDIFAAGRTDSGVNAYGQVAHFDLEHEIDTYRFLGSLNHFLKGEQISILKIEPVNEDFHARFSAKTRHYIYKIINRTSAPVIDLDRKLWVRQPLDVQAMQKAANLLLGSHDFTSFRASMCQASSPVKTIDKIDIQRYNDDIILEISAKSFLHNMVRNIVGTLINVGNGKWKYDYINQILSAKNRSAAGPTAKAHALYFLKVDY